MTEGEARSQPTYRQLTRRLILVMVAVSLVPLLFTGGMILHYFSAAYRERVYDHLEELVQKHSQGIDTFLTDRLAKIRLLARSHSREELADQRFLDRLLSLLRDEYGGNFVDLGLVAPDGRQVNYAGPLDLGGADYRQAAWFAAAGRGQSLVSDVFSGLRGSPHFIVAARLGDPAAPGYLLRATINFETFNALVANLKLGATGFAFIVNRRQEFQTKPRQAVLLDGAPLLAVLGESVGLSRATVRELTGRDGKEYLLALAPLKAGQWVLCLQQEEADAFREVHRTFRWALLLLGLSGLVVLAVATTLSRRMVGRIAEADRQKSRMGQKILEAGRLASLGEMAAGISHEVNNPVAIMVEEAGWIEDLLQDPDPLGEIGEIKRAIGQIKTQGERCKLITQKLLSFARNTDPALHEVGLNQAVEEVVRLLEKNIRYAGVQLATELAAPEPMVKASPSELQQVLVNLINNAVDAMRAGGGHLRLVTGEEGGRAVLTVSDDGPGIAEADLERIFDPFFTTKPVGQGTGLGLSICYGIIDKLGGTISVQSQPQQGTSFTIRLPRVEAAAPPPPAETAAG